MSTTKTYEIHDNGGRPFLVVVEHHRIYVYLQKYDEETHKYMKVKEVISTSYKNVYVGDNKLNVVGYAPKGKFKGNSILINVAGDKYIYVGSEIYEFNAINDDSIKDFLSPVGNSDVPYPYAVSKENVYLMLDKATVPAVLFDLKKDVYGQFYGYGVESEQLKNAIEHFKKPLKVRLIHKRI